MPACLPVQGADTAVLVMQDGGVMLVATTRDNVSPSLVLELLRRVGGIIKVQSQPVHHACIQMWWLCIALCFKQYLQCKITTYGHSHDCMI